MRVAAVIVNYRTPDLVIKCLASLACERSSIPDLQVVVVDNASGDGSASILFAELSSERYADWVHFVPLEINGGFGWGNNQAILALLEGPLPPDAIFLLNPDAVIQAGALIALVADMQQRADAGAIGSQLLNEDGTLAGSAFRFPTITSEFIRGLGIGAVGRLLRIPPVLMPYGLRGSTDWVTGASVLVRSQALRDAGMFDTGFFLYFEEVELMYRFRKYGWNSYHCPESRVWHIAGASTGVVNNARGRGAVPPDYVFRSRHRYFALTNGRVSALLADFAWIIGVTLSLILLALRVRKNTPGSWNECFRLMQIGVGGCPGDNRPAITQVGDLLGQDPAWLSAPSVKI